MLGRGPTQCSAALARGTPLGFRFSFAFSYFRLLEYTALWELSGARLKGYLLLSRWASFCINLEMVSQEAVRGHSGTGILG